MKRALLFFTLFCISLFTTTNATETSTLTLTLVNHSTETLSYNGAIQFDTKNNTFNINPTVIPPEKTAVITATTTELADLNGKLLFTDSSKRNNIFIIVDKRMFHAGQPLFALTEQSHTLKSSITSLTFNHDAKPRSLSYTAATVEVTSR